MAKAQTTTISPPLDFSFFHELPQHTIDTINKRLDFLQTNNVLLQILLDDLPFQTTMRSRLGCHSSVSESITELQLKHFDLHLVDISSAQKESQFPLKYIWTDDCGCIQIYKANKGFNGIRMGTATFAQTLQSVHYFYQNMLKIPPTTCFSALSIPNIMMHGALKPINGSHEIILNRIRDNCWVNSVEEYVGETLNVEGVVEELDDKDTIKKHKHASNTRIVGYHTGKVCFCGIHCIQNFIDAIRVIEYLYTL